MFIFLFPKSNSKINPTPQLSDQYNNKKSHSKNKSEANNIYPTTHKQMYPSHQRKLPRHFPPNDTFYVELTQLQAKTLAFLMPKGCSIFQQAKSKVKQIPPKPKQQINPYSPAAFQTSINKPAHHLTHTKQLSQPKQAPTKQQPPKKPTKQQIPQSVKPMLPILQQLKTYKHSWPFLQPVDAQNLGIPQYYQIVKQPMDLSKIQTKLKSAKYSTPQQFYRDVNLMIKNSYIFNAANDQFVKLTSDFERYFWRLAGAQAKPANDKKLQRQKQKERERLQKQRLKEEKIKDKIMEKEKQKQRKMILQQQQQAELALKVVKKKKKFIPKDMLQAQNISIQQKQQLANNIHSLSKQHLKGIRQIVFAVDKQQQGITHMPSLKPANQHQFDIQKIGYKKIRELQKYVRAKLSEMENTKYSDEMVEKKNEVDLDEIDSEWTEEFVE